MQKNPGSSVCKAKKAPTTAENSSPISLNAPVLITKGPYIDCSCAILSRQFDRDRDRVLARSVEDGVAAVLVWFSDVNKQQTISDLCKANSGQ